MSTENEKVDITGRSYLWEGALPLIDLTQNFSSLILNSLNHRKPDISPPDYRI
jgi:hypothetical protein